MNYLEFVEIVESNPSLKTWSSKNLANKLKVAEDEIKEFREWYKAKTPIGTPSSAIQPDSFLHKEILDSIPTIEELEKVDFKLDPRIPKPIQGYNISSFCVDKVWYKKDEEVTPTDFNLDEFRRIIKQEVTPVKLQSKVTNKKKSEKIFCLSDIHVGMSTEQNNWNKELMIERVLEILNHTDNCTDVTLLFLGDGIDGLNSQTTRGGHKLPQNMNNQEQILALVEAFKLLIDGLAQQVKEGKIENICFTGVYESNHSGDMDYLVVQIVKMWCELKYPDIEFFTPMSVFSGFESNYGGYKILFTHGKESKNAKYGLPMNLDAKNEVLLMQEFFNYRDSDGNNFISPDCTKNIIISGDLHTRSFSQGKFFQYYKVPALCPTSDWCKANYGESVSGIQYLNIFEDKIEEGVIYFN